MSKLSDFYAHRKEMLKGHRDWSLFWTSEPVTMIPDGFLKPSVDYQLLLFTEVINLKTLVFDCLFVATNTDITVNHNFFLQR